MIDSPRPLPYVVAQAAFASRWECVSSGGHTVSQVRFVYKSSIAVSCFLLMLASIACTGWFFYTWLGGIPGIVGAAVGCAVQIMAYGFSGVVVHQANGLLRVVLLLLIASALSLSVLSSYATLTGYFSALERDRLFRQASISQKEQAVQTALAQRMQLLQSMARDVELGSEAANQGLAEKYRTQASQFLTSNAATREDIEAQIEKLETLAESNLLQAPPPEAGSPIDGLANVVGGQHMAIIVLCAWLALMFDALPIAGITLLETRGLRKTLAEPEAHAEPADDDEFAHRAAYFVQSLQDEETRLLTDESTRDEYKILTNICSADLPLSKAFFVQLLGLEVKYETDWYVQLCSPHDQDLEFGVIQHNHELIPADYQSAPSGMYLTFLVPDVDATYERALSLGVDILQEPRNEFYGQRRFLAREPSGCLLDICSPWQA